MFLHFPRRQSHVFLCLSKHGLQKWRSSKGGYQKNVSGLIMKKATEVHNTKWVSIPYTLFQKQVHTNLQAELFLFLTSNSDLYHFNPVTEGKLCEKVDPSLHSFYSIYLSFPGLEYVHINPNCSKTMVCRMTRTMSYLSLCLAQSFVLISSLVNVVWIE